MNAIYWTYDHWRPEWVAEHDTISANDLCDYFETKAQALKESEEAA